MKDFDVSVFPAHDLKYKGLIFNLLLVFNAQPILLAVTCRTFFDIGLTITVHYFEY
jgi:hypothetical protein